MRPRSNTTTAPKRLAASRIAASRIAACLLALTAVSGAQAQSRGVALRTLTPKVSTKISATAGVTKTSAYTRPVAKPAAPTPSTVSAVAVQKTPATIAEHIESVYSQPRAAAEARQAPRNVQIPPQGKRRVLVEVSTKAIDALMPDALAAKLNTSALIEARRQALAGAVTGLSPAIEALGARVKSSFANVPLLIVEIDDNDVLDSLAKLVDVGQVHENMLFHPSLAETLPVIGQPAAEAAGATGLGTTVAVLDTGVDYTLPEFGACRFPGARGCRVVDARDITAFSDGAMDDDGHGTNVAAIVAGVAPQANIIAVDVFVEIAGEQTVDAIGLAAAIDYVIETKSRFNTVAINMSLGTDGFGTRRNCISPLDAMFTAALRAGITPVVAAGNDGNPNRLAFPGCSTTAVSVGATDNDDNVAGFSNASSALDLMAPGVDVTAGGFTMSGTSMAAPHVAGAFAVMHSGRADLNSAEVLQALKDTGTTVVDSRTRRRFPRIQLDAALTWTGTASFLPDFTQVDLNFESDWVNCQMTEVSDGLTCGFEQVSQTITDAAQCGEDSITDAAQCGSDLVACGTSIVGAVGSCLGGLFSADGCEAELMCEQPRTCKVPASCEVLRDCNPITEACSPLTCEVEICQ